MKERSERLEVKLLLFAIQKTTGFEKFLAQKFSTSSYMEAVSYQTVCLCFISEGLSLSTSCFLSDSITLFYLVDASQTSQGNKWKWWTCYSAWAHLFVSPSVFCRSFVILTSPSFPPPPSLSLSLSFPIIFFLHSPLPLPNCVSHHVNYVHNFTWLFRECSTWNWHRTPPLSWEWYRAALSLISLSTSSLRMG